MKGCLPFKIVAASAVAASALCAGTSFVDAAGYAQTNLVSDVSGLASITNSQLKNPWGLSFISGFSPFWISNQGTNTTTLYGVTGATSVSEFAVNPPSNSVAVPGGPTGQVSNTNPSVLQRRPLHLRRSERLNLRVERRLERRHRMEHSGVAYTGLAINTAQTELYAASAGGIDVYNSSFTPIGTMFTTPGDIASAGLVPFNVKDIGGDVFVTYAPSGHTAQTTATLGEGAVAVFSESGTLMSETLGGDDHLASPWGVAIAPMTFGKFGGDVLVGNFSFDHSEINAFDPTNWDFEGTISVDAGLGQTPGGLWSLSFGAGGLDGSSNVLYFTDGINGETDGLFGAIVSVPEPSTWALILAGFAGLSLVAFQRSRKRGLAPVAAR